MLKLSVPLVRFNELFSRLRAGVRNATRNYSKPCIERSLKKEKCREKKAEDLVCPEPKPSCPLGDDPCKPSKLKFWRNASLFIGLPTVILMSIEIFIRNPEYTIQQDCVPYEHLHRRLKRFPWGGDNEKKMNQTLFHNPFLNIEPPCCAYQMDPCIDPCAEPEEEPAEEAAA